MRFLCEWRGGEHGRLTSDDVRGPQSLGGMTWQAVRVPATDGGIARVLWLWRAEVNSDRQRSIHEIVSLHLRIKLPLLKCLESGHVQLAIFRGFEDHDSGFRRFADQDADFHPVVNGLPL